MRAKIILRLREVIKNNDLENTSINVDSDETFGNVHLTDLSEDRLLQIYDMAIGIAAIDEQIRKEFLS